MTETAIETGTGTAVDPVARGRETLSGTAVSGGRHRPTAGRLLRMMGELEDTTLEFDAQMRETGEEHGAHHAMTGTDTQHSTQRRTQRAMWRRQLTGGTACLRCAV